MLVIKIFSAMLVALRLYPIEMINRQGKREIKLGTQFNDFIRGETVNFFYDNYSKHDDFPTITLYSLLFAQFRRTHIPKCIVTLMIKA